MAKRSGEPNIFEFGLLMPDKDIYKTIGQLRTELKKLRPNTVATLLIAFNKRSIAASVAMQADGSVFKDDAARIAFEIAFEFLRKEYFN